MYYVFRMLSIVLIWHSQILSQTISAFPIDSLIKHLYIISRHFVIRRYLSARKIDNIYWQLQPDFLYDKSSFPCC